MIFAVLEEEGTYQFMTRINLIGRFISGSVEYAFPIMPVITFSFVMLPKYGGFRPIVVFHVSSDSCLSGK
jgi:hypothetical protein